MESKELASGERIVTHDSGRQHLVSGPGHPAPAEYYKARVEEQMADTKMMLQKLGYSLSRHRVNR